MPGIKQMRGTGSTEKALNKIFKKVNRKPPKAKTLPKKKAKGQTFTVGQKAPAVGSAERDADLEALVAKPRAKKAGKKKAPKRYY